VKVVLDSNALLVSISKKSFYRPIFDAFLENKYLLAISNEVLTEYAEVLTRFASSTVADNITELLATKDNAIKTEISYHWRLINADLDDNKFVDLSVASDANFIVTNDAHFEVLKGIPFPKVSVINIQDFLEIVKKL
jgi:uncharacterized protein